MQDPSDITEVTPQVSITNARTGQRSADLVARGFGAVLCLDRKRINYDHPSRPIDIALCHLDNDRTSPAIFEYAVDQLLELVEEQKKVLVHCNAGLNRSVAVVAAYLCETEGLPAAEALDRVANLRGGLDMLVDRFKNLVLHRSHTD